MNEFHLFEFQTDYKEEGRLMKIENYTPKDTFELRILFEELQFSVFFDYKIIFSFPYQNVYTEDRYQTWPEPRKFMLDPFHSFDYARVHTSN